MPAYMQRLKESNKYDCLHSLKAHEKLVSRPEKLGLSAEGMQGGHAEGHAGGRARGPCRGACKGSCRGACKGACKGARKGACRGAHQLSEAEPDSTLCPCAGPGVTEGVQSHAVQHGDDIRQGCLELAGPCPSIAVRRLLGPASPSLVLKRSNKCVFIQAMTFA